MKQIKTIGIVGYGQFGTFVYEFGQYHFPHLQFRVYSSRWTPDQQTFFSFAEVARSDVVILCGPIHAYEAQLHNVLAHAAAQTIIVDVATVKEYTNKLFKRYCTHQPYLCTHPMFGPESYQKQQGQVTGLRIVVTDHTLPEESYQTLKNIFATLGFLIIEISAAEHDERLAETLFLTHYVSQSIVTAGFGRTAIDTVSFSRLMDAVESVQANSDLFTDVYRYNQHCEAVAKRLHLAHEQVYRVLRDESASQA